MDTDNIQKDLLYTQDLRKKLIGKLCNSDKLEELNIPNDPKEIRLLLDISKTMDSQTIAIRKIESDEGINDKAVAASANIAHILSTRSAQELLPQSTELKGVILEIDDSLIEGVTIVEGELETNPTPLNYDSFMSKMDPNGQ